MRTRQVWGSIALAVSLLPVVGCGVFFGADQEAANARRDLAPIQEIGDAPNPLIGGDGSSGDRAMAERRRRERRASTTTTSTTINIPRDAPGAPPEGLIVLVEPPNFDSPPDPVAAGVDLPFTSTPKAPPTTSPEGLTPYCVAISRLMTAGTAIWKFYWSADAPTRRAMFSELHDSITRFAALVGEEEIAVRLRIVDAGFGRSFAMGFDGAVPQQAADLLATWSPYMGTALTPLLRAATGRCLEAREGESAAMEVDAYVPPEAIYAYFRVTP